MQSRDRSAKTIGCAELLPRKFHVRDALEAFDPTNERISFIGINVELCRLAAKARESRSAENYGRQSCSG